MSEEFLDRISRLSPKRLALLALELHEQIESAREQAHEPIAVIGVGCRFPGAGDPAGFWALLDAGRDAIRTVPPDRWDMADYFDPDADAPGRMSVRHGGFLDRVDGFDAPFFGITPREAQTMDPQQRLLLEVAWEALEDAAIAPDRLGGSATGVFVGICNSDHFQRLLRRGDAAIDAYLASGSAHSVAAGRIAYCLGLQGPALSIDTACSSSLVALHAACASLRRGESSMALCGGVNVMASPETTIALSKAHMLAPDGRCKTFDARADGFSRGEGCGVLVLKRLRDAIAGGDRILALVRGTAVNQDGRSGGLTVPSGPAQEAVIRAALADAGLEPSCVSYVEAHGTGTSLGDPIEVRALANVFGPDRPADTPLWIGSVKTNVGHLESAAGLAGVLKVILALQHERVPAHLNFREPTPHIPWDGIPIQVSASARPWDRGAQPRVAGVSSFGFSGTNAHVILEEAPERAARAAADGARRPWLCLPIAARSGAALRELADRYARALEPRPGALEDLAHTAGVGRARLPERAAVVARDAEAAREALAACAAGLPHPDVHLGTAEPRPCEVVFLFTGQGAQYPGMARGLYEASPVFREVIDRCDCALGADAAGRTLRSVLWPDSQQDRLLHQTRWTQPALFAVEYGLAALWQSWGIRPSAAIGHSVGEYVAACVAGVFSFEDGLRLVAERGRLMQGLPEGTMAAVFAPAAEVEAAVAPLSGQVAIAAVNAADSVVISGEPTAVDAVLAGFERRGIKGHRLFVSLAAHSPLVEPALDALESCAARITMQAPTLPVAWNVTGTTRLPTGAPDAAYWRRHLREPVRFADGLLALHREGFTTFLEVGPHPTLIALAQRSLPEQGTLCLTSLRRGMDDWHELTTSLARLFVHGGAVDFAGVDAPYYPERIQAPTYPFERRSYWVPFLRRQQTALPAVLPPDAPLHGTRLDTAAAIFEHHLTTASPAYLAEHRVCGAPIVAGPVYLEMVQACARSHLGHGTLAVDGFTIHRPLVLAGAGHTVQVELASAADANATTFSVHGRPAGSTAEWQLHATGRLISPTGVPADGAGHRPSAEDGEPAGEHYQRLAQLGIELGPSFQTLRRFRRDSSGVIAEIELPPARSADVVSWIHPCLLDGALQAVGLAVPGDSAGVYLFTGAERMHVVSPPARLTCEVRLRPADADGREMTADVVLRHPDGGWCGELRGIRLRRARQDTLHRLAIPGTPDGLFYGIQWEPIPEAERPAVRPLASARQLAATAAEGFGALARRFGLSIYDQLLPALDRVSLAYVCQALDELGMDRTPGRRFDPGAEAERLGIVPRHRRLFARLVQMLIADGAVVARGADVEVGPMWPRERPVDVLEGISRETASASAELATLIRCGPKLAQVLTGRQDPLHLLFPGGSFDEARRLYVESPYARTFNTALAGVVGEALAAVPAGSRLRVLEIGAGTGGTTTYVLPLLPEDRAEFTFTDLSPLFLERAAEQFGHVRSMRRALLDIERDPIAQGFDAGAYDVVIAANVLHATDDLRRALTHARRLLAPNGLLVLLEGVAPERWVDLTFGLTEGWWRFSDVDLRPDYPLLSRERWLELLRDCGFAEAHAIPGAAGESKAAAQQTLLVAQSPARAVRWTLVGEDGTVGALARRLRERGDDVRCVPGAAVGPEDLAADRLVYLDALPLASCDAGAPEAAARCREIACERPLELLSAAARAGGSGRVWLVTKGAVNAGGRMAPGGLWQAPLWGAGRVFALEQPQQWGGLVDLPPDTSREEDVATLLPALDSGDGEDQTAWRDGQRLAARLTHEQPPAVVRPLPIRRDATYLISGGFGGLGVLVGKWLAQQGAGAIALLGRNPDPSDAAVKAIEAAGARVIALAADVADGAAVDRALATLPADAPPLAGIVHAAADLSTAPLTSLGPAAVQRMLRPKVDGTLVLERVARRRNLDWLVLFSSTTALLGARGFAHYAAANAFLDAAATAAVGAARQVIAVNWGTWEAMRLASAESQRQFREGGLLPMPAAAALEALGTVLRSEARQAIVADIDWSVLRPLHEARRARPLLAGLGRPAEPARPKSQGDDGFRARFDAAPAAARQDLMLAFVAGEAAAVLGLPDGEPVPLATGLFELGMDSLMSVELRRRLERGTGASLPTTLTFNYPTVSALAAFIAARLTPASVADVANVPDPASAGAAPDCSEGELDALSDEEIERRLLARLEETR